MGIVHNDEYYYQNIRDYLIQRAHAVRVDANLNRLSLAGMSEDFYVEFLNILLDLSLENANDSDRNAPGIDLIDYENQVAVQVSVTCAPDTIRKKIRGSVKRFEKPDGKDWQFYFVPITDKAPELKSDFTLPEGLLFDRTRDVLDITRIMELAKGIDKLKKLSLLVEKYNTTEHLKTEQLHNGLREKLDKLLLKTWKQHRSFKLMQTDEIDRRLFPGIRDSHQFEALGKRKEDESDSPVWTIIRESWKEPENHPVMIEGGGGIGKTVTLFSLTNMDKDTIPAPAVYVPMFDLIDQDKKVVGLSDYFMSSKSLSPLNAEDRKGLCSLAERFWDNGPSLLVLLDGFNEVPGALRWSLLQMLRDWHEWNSGAQLIAVSRPMDNLSLKTAFGEETISVTLSELTKESVTAYLKTIQGEGVRLPDPNASIWTTIVYPLFLNLYIKADRLRNQEAWKDYPLDVREAAGPGSIIWNFLQRELLRCEDESWILRCAVACEYLAPILANHMMQRYDYTISLKEAVEVIEKAAAQMDLDRMPAHLTELISWWKMQELSVELPHFLKGLNWPDVVLRESGLLQPYLGQHAGKAGQQREPRFEFLHQNFRDCLVGLHLVNQAEISRGIRIPDIWGKDQSHLVLNYTAELIAPKTAKQLWNANLRAQQYESASYKPNHSATYNLLELYKCNRKLFCDLNFSGMDLQGLSLTHYLRKDEMSPALPLFRSSATTEKTNLGRSVFECKEGHSGSVTVLAALSDGCVVSGSEDCTLRVWNVFSGQCLQTLEGHRSTITCVATLPGGRVISGSADCTVRVWDVTTGQCLQILEGHYWSVNCIAVLPDGRVISGDGSQSLGHWSGCALRIWDVTTGQCLKTLEGHGISINCLAVFPDGRVVGGLRDKTLQVWDTATGQCLQIIEGHSGWVNLVAILPDGRVVSPDNDTLRVWDTATGQCLQTLEGHSGSVNCIAILPDGRMVSGSSDHTLRVWDTATGQCLQTLEGHSNFVTHVAVLPNGCVISGSGYYGYGDYSFRVWDATTGKCLRTIEFYSWGGIHCMAVLPDGQVVGSSIHGDLRVWDSVTGQHLQTLGRHGVDVTCVAVLPDGRIISGSSDDHTLRVWDTVTGQCLQTLEGHSGEVSCVDILPDGHVVSGSSDRTLRVWDAASGQCLQTLRGHYGFVNCMAFLPDGRVVSGSYDHTLRVWDALSGQCLQNLVGYDRDTCMAVLTDGHVVSGSADNTLRVWDVTSGQCLQTLEGHTSRVTCLAVLPDGRVVSGSEDSTLRVWDAATGQCLQTLEGHRRCVNCVAVLPDGRVVSGSSDSTLRVWDAATGQCLQILEGHNYTVTCVAVLPDGRVVSDSDDSTLRVWDAASGQCLQTLEGHRRTIRCIGILPNGRVVSSSWDNTLRIWDADSGDCLDILEPMVVPVSGMDFSRAKITEDLAGLLYHNGARISERDYRRWAEANHIHVDKAFV